MLSLKFMLPKAAYSRTCTEWIVWCTIFFNTFFQLKFVFNCFQFPSHTDVDECAVHSDSCDATNGVCTNMLGTFNCSCTAGYELDLDGRTCNGKILIFRLFCLDMEYAITLWRLREKHEYKDLNKLSQDLWDRWYLHNFINICLIVCAPYSSILFLVKFVFIVFNSPLIQMSMNVMFIQTRVIQVNEVCTNMPGTFSCSCAAGYVLSELSWGFIIQTFK